MNTSDRKLYRRLHELTVRQFESSLADGEHAELESLLLENAQARRLYVQYFQETACLRWLCLEEYADAADNVAAVELAAEKPHLRVRLSRALAVLVAVSCALLLAFWLQGIWLKGFKGAEGAVEPMPNGQLTGVVAENKSGSPTAQPAAAQAAEQVATITRVKAARWLEAAENGGLLARCSVGQRCRLSAGQAELTFDSGVLVTVFGPADFDITSPMSIRCRRGRVTALVDERGKGFTVDTPQGKVIDLGTQFGLDISPTGETQVVVFKGRVDLAPETGSVRRMEQGDALLIKNTGEIERLVSIRHDDFLDRSERELQSPPLIAAVRDNIRTGHSLKSYQIVQHGLREDVQAFVDRDHEWNSIDDSGLPDYLLGADYIMPFNDDKFVTDLELTVELSRPATLYVFVDNNMEVPHWVRDEFEDTGADIGLDGAKTIWHPANSLEKGAGKSVDFTFSVWRKTVTSPGAVVLRGLTPPPVGFRSLGFNMYGIAAVDLKPAEAASGQ